MARLLTNRSTRSDVGVGIHVVIGEKYENKFWSQITSLAASERPIYSGL